MARKNKATGKKEPNAPPELQQVLLDHTRQPAHNPYYPDPSLIANLPPPPYSQLTTPLTTTSYNSVPMAHINNADLSAYPREPSVIIQSVPSNLPYDSRIERYHQRVKSFNRHSLLVSILIFTLAIWAHNQYSDRPCIWSATVHKPNKDLDITFSTVRYMHLDVACGSCVIFILCVVRAISGKSSSYSCYLFLMGLCSFVLTLHTGYLAYLAFFSPCAINFNEYLRNGAKSFLASISDSLPAPDRGFFGEKSVFNYVEDDRKGVLIFVADLVNFLLYFGTFINAIVLC